MAGRRVIVRDVRGCMRRVAVRLFQSHITRLDNTLRWRWQTDDILIWDNSATQHKARDTIYLAVRPN